MQFKQFSLNKKLRNMTTLHFRKSIGRSLSGRCGFVLVPLALLCFGLLPTAQALLPAPSPDGNYPGGNTAEGINALHDVNTAVGINNTAVGANALTNDTTGQYNVAVGSGALASNTTGDFNMAIGTEALKNNNASFNLAIGFRVLFMNTTGSNLTGIGAAALRNNTTGSFNTAIGADALRNNVDGDENNALGNRALRDNVSGSRNTAIGKDALLVSTLNDNTAIGNDAGSNIVDGSGNSLIGSNAGSSIVHANAVIAIGNVPGVSSVSGEKDNSCYIQNIYNEPIGGAGVPHAVWVDADGTLGLMPSSRRFKHDIKPMDKASETLYGLKPVTFQYNSDKKGRSQYGLIAEEVAEVSPDLILRDNKGQIASVRYEQVNAMLLNEFLKEHREVAELKSTIAEQRKGMEAMAAQLKEQAAQIQKMSAQLEASKPAPQVVNNP